VDSAVDAPCVLSLCSAMFFPASLIAKRDIIPGIRQRMRTSLLTPFDGDAVRFEDFFCRFVAEVSPPLVRCSGVTEKSTIFNPANPWDWLLAVPIKLNDSGSDALLQMEKGATAVEFRAFQGNEPLSRLKNGAAFDFFDAHWFPLKGNREVIRDFPTGNRKS
jgi:hypothetical protein